MTELSERIELRLDAALGPGLIVEDDGRRLVVSGTVDTPEARTDALDIVRAAAPDRAIDDGIEVGTALPEETAGVELSAEDVGALRGATAELADEGEAIEAVDFTDQETLHSPQYASGPSSSIEEDKTSEGGAVYTPPIDPVGTHMEVIGGLQSSSMDSVEVDRSASDNVPGDEALRDAILRELREDSATRWLEVEVVVDRRVARLRGRVPYLEDAENAEEVANRVPGLLEVIDETDVEQFESD